jgi:hypothetical protein
VDAVTNLTATRRSEIAMEQTRTAVTPWHVGLPLVAAAAGFLTLYVTGLDQGFLLSLVQGAPAYDQNLLHEFVHDARHAAGFPCH